MTIKYNILKLNNKLYFIIIINFIIIYLYFNNIKMITNSK